MRFWIMLGLLALVLLAGCTGPTPPSDDNNPTSEMEVEKGSADKFAFGFMIPLTSKVDESDNFLYSPISIRSAFGLAYLGSKGNTAREISDVFGFKGDNPDFSVDIVKRDNFTFISDDGSLDDVEKYTLSVAGSLWVDDEYTLKQSYMNRVSNYGASVYNKDLNSNEFVSAANAWISDKTFGLIQNFVDQPLPRGTPLVIFSTAYFNGTWEYPFEPQNTREDTFYNPLLGESTVEYMTNTEDYEYGSDDKFEMVALPYKEGAVFYVIKPTAEDYDKYPVLTYDEFSKLKSKLSDREVEIYLPKFSFHTPKYNLVESFKAMGIKDAFDCGKADFSDLVDINKKVCIGRVLHKAKIDVNEYGTEAAAVTEIDFVVSMSPYGDQEEPIVFRADHPFYYVIEDPDYGVLFVGRFAGPQ